MGFLVGNDFIPNLPNMHIRQVLLYIVYLKVTIIRGYNFSAY